METTLRSLVFGPSLLALIGPVFAQRLVQQADGSCYTAARAQLNAKIAQQPNLCRAKNVVLFFVNRLSVPTITPPASMKASSAASTANPTSSPSRRCCPIPRCRKPTPMMRRSPTRRRRADPAHRILTDPDAAFSAPLAFGDSHGKSLLVGTTAEFVTPLSGPLAEGGVFSWIEEAVVGALIGAKIGDWLEIRHGDADGLSGGLDADA